MFKKYPLGIAFFILIGLIATLFPPYRWGNEAYVNGPIERRAFIFGDSWRTVQTGWGWEPDPKVMTIYWIRSSFYDSLVAVFSRSPICQWMKAKMPKPKLEFDLSDIEFRGNPHEPLGPPLEKPAAAKRSKPPVGNKHILDSLGHNCLLDVRKTFPSYADMNDSILVVRIVRNCPPELSPDSFSNEMDDDSVRLQKLLLFSELGLVARDSLGVLDTLLAPPSKAYHSTRQYAEIHGNLNLAELVVDYLIALFLAATLEVARLLLSLFSRKVAGKQT
jgi:hypothetical protein